MKPRTVAGAVCSAARRAALVGFTLGLAGVSAAAGAATPKTAAGEPGLRFEQVFSDDGEPPALHYRADYGANHGANHGAAGAPHRLEVWRDGGRRLVRRTDGVIETHVAHRPGDPDFQLVVLDLQRKIETRIARDDLYRIGNFTDWFDLAHGLRHPRAAYRLTVSAAPAHAPKPLQACNWYTLAQGGHSTRLCWSAAARLPLLMLDDSGQVLWQVTALDSKPAAAAVFEVHDIGFVHNDASQDISND
jgi:hypothetical protein